MASEFDQQQQERERASRIRAARQVGRRFQQRQEREKREAQQLEKRGDQNNLVRQAALAQRRKAERQRQAYLAAATAGELSGKDKKDKNKDYPNPITTLGFLGFGVVALIQDGVPAVFDLMLGIGWVFGYLLLPFTWGMYWYLIIRRAPKSLQRKFVMRTALVTAAGLIPYLGEILPEWIATAIGAYIYIKRYESGGASIEDISSTTKNLAQGKSASK